MFPLNTSTILNNAKNRLDFPEPVLPTMPIFSDGSTSNETLLRANGKFGLYRNLTCLKLTDPCIGQYGGG